MNWKVIDEPINMDFNVNVNVINEPMQESNDNEPYPAHFLMVDPDSRAL